MKFVPEILNHILLFMEFDQYGKVNMYNYLYIQTYYKRYPMAELEMRVKKYTQFNSKSVNNIFSCYKSLIIYPYINITKMTIREAILNICNRIILCYDTVFHDCINVITGLTCNDEPFIIMYGFTNRQNFMCIMLYNAHDDWTYCLNYIQKSCQLSRVQCLLRHTVCVQT